MRILLTSDRHIARSKNDFRQITAHGENIAHESNLSARALFELCHHATFSAGAKRTSARERRRLEFSARSRPRSSPFSRRPKRSHFHHHGSRTVSAYVVVQLARTGAAKRARGERGEHPALARHKVRQLLTEHGGELLATEPPTSTRDEIASATIAVPDMACAHKLAAALRDMDGIETAYAKPAEELP
jgi:hypothetical protein